MSAEKNETAEEIKSRILQNNNVDKDTTKETADLKWDDLLPHNTEGAENTEKFLRAVVDILIDYVKNENDRETPVLDFHHPTDMLKFFDLAIKDEPEQVGKLLEHCSRVLQYQVKTGHPRFFNQISCGLDIVSLAGEWLTATANTNMFTYEIAPVFILMEAQLLAQMRRCIGWDEGDGIFAPGGSISNIYAVIAARHKHFPRSKALGNSSIPTLTMFTSSDSHYSIRGAAAACGIGMDNCISVPVDEQHRMIPEALEQLIKKSERTGEYPFFVNATAGTTVYGAFDPIRRLARICKKHGLWLHVDAAWGGGLLLSQKHRHRLDGIDLADSVTWNPHKMMGALLQCSAILLKEEGLLFQANQMSADYLFMQDKPYDCSYDTGDKAIQCGRHNDIFKLWLMWRAKGMQGFEQQIDRLMDLAVYFTTRIKSIAEYEMVLENPQYVNICFWYIPKYLNQFDEREKRARLEKIAPKIKAGMMKRGTTMVGYQPDLDKPNFFRLIVSNPAITVDDLDFLIDEIISIGEGLEQKAEEDLGIYS